MTEPSTTPYAWPFDQVIHRDRAALILCGALGVWADRTPHDPTVEDALARLRAGAHAAAIEVVLLRNLVDPRPHAIEHPSPQLRPADNEIVVDAAGIDGFYGSPLDAHLNQTGRTHLLFAGRGFESTVHSTLRRANDRGYECLTVHDACATIDPTLRAASISTIEMSGGIFGAVGTTAFALDALRAIPESPN